VFATHASKIGHMQVRSALHELILGIIRVKML